MKKLLSLSLMLSLGLATISPTLNAAQAQRGSRMPAWTKSPGFAAAKKWWRAGRNMNALNPQERKAFTALKTKVGITAIVTIILGLLAASAKYKYSQTKKGEDPIVQDRGRKREIRSLPDAAYKWITSGKGAGALAGLEADEVQAKYDQLAQDLERLPDRMGRGKYNKRDLVYFVRRAYELVTPDEFFELIDTYKDYHIVFHILSKMNLLGQALDEAKKNAAKNPEILEYLEEISGGSVNSLERYLQDINPAPTTKGIKNKK